MSIIDRKLYFLQGEKSISFGDGKQQKPRRAQTPPPECEYGDYDAIPIDASMISVEAQIKGKHHGFTRYVPYHLKDPRYQKVIAAIFDLIDLREIFQTQRAQQPS